MVKQWIALVGIINMMAFPAMARIWVIDKDKSILSFNAIQNDANVSGTFENFDGEINFDPKKLNESYINITVDMVSLTSSYKEMTDTLKKSDWLAVSNFPKAVFESKEVTLVKDKHYSAKGMLTLRDQTLPLTVEFDLDEYADTHASVKGSASLSRTAFGVGQGEWKDTSSVKDKVVVTFIIDATPQAK